jgi:hypothetical protein
VLVGAFDCVRYVVQMAVPRVELGWVPDIGILLTAAALLTLYGTRRGAPA